METTANEPIVVLSSGEESEDEDASGSDIFAGDRPPSDEEYESSITLSSGEEEVDEQQQDDCPKEHAAHTGYTTWLLVHLVFQRIAALQIVIGCICQNNLI